VNLTWAESRRVLRAPRVRRARERTDPPPGSPTGLAALSAVPAGSPALDDSHDEGATGRRSRTCKQVTYGTWTARAQPAARSASWTGMLSREYAPLEHGPPRAPAHLAPGRRRSTRRSLAGSLRARFRRLLGAVRGLAAGRPPNADEDPERRPQKTNTGARGDRVPRTSGSFEACQDAQKTAADPRRAAGREGLSA